MNTVFNTQEKPVIVSGYPGPLQCSAAGRFSRRTLLDPVNVERAAVLYFAELAALRLDREFFRREPGPGVNALALALTGETCAGSGMDYRTFQFRLFGADEDADRLKQRMMLIAGSIGGAGWITVSSRRVTESVIFTGWSVQPVTFSMTADSGKVRYAAEMPLTGTVCTSPPEPFLRSN